MCRSFTVNYQFYRKKLKQINQINDNIDLVLGSNSLTHRVSADIAAYIHFIVIDLPVGH